MRPGSIIYFFREAGKSLKRNRLLSFATITTVAVCILILGFGVLFTINASNFMNHLESDVQIRAFLEQDLTASQISDIGRKIEAIPGVGSNKFISRDEALQQMQKDFGRREYDLKETLGKNPLPHTYMVKVKNPREVSQLAAKIKSMPGVYKVNYGQGTVEKLFKVTRWMRIIGIIFIVLLLVGAVFLIATTIRLAIFARRKEIYLMKLIGSTDWFIRWPFFLEGILLSSLGALISIGILAMAYGSLISKIDNLFFIQLVSDAGTIRNLYLVLLGTGAGLGVVGTWISLNRFLKV
ncbi:MAG: ABC transporter permease [Syntrophomonadaceae bacterium]|nr:ABC transporter permease [Syntrophomonadaceae bacterium]